MDRFLAGVAFESDGDLRLCFDAGVAYQADMSAGRVQYDDRYWSKVAAYEGGAIARAVNIGRCNLLKRHLRPGCSVIDIGAGTGAFVRAARYAGFHAMGFDVMPRAARMLRAHGLYASDVSQFEAVTLWDSLEHMDDPASTLESLAPGSRAFVSIPVFDDLRRIRESKHYRPGEHLYYWTADGFVAWMERYGFICKERSGHETEAGRESIGAFAFRKVVSQ